MKGITKARSILESPDETALELVLHTMEAANTRLRDDAQALDFVLDTMAAAEAKLKSRERALNFIFELMDTGERRTAYIAEAWDIVSKADPEGASVWRMAKAVRWANSWTEDWPQIREKGIAFAAHMSAEKWARVQADAAAQPAGPPIRNLEDILGIRLTTTSGMNLAEILGEDPNATPDQLRQALETRATQRITQEKAA